MKIEHERSSDVSNVVVYILFIVGAAIVLMHVSAINYEATEQK